MVAAKLSGERAARPAPNRRAQRSGSLVLRPGASLGYAPNAAAKELIVAGLAAMDVTVLCVIQRYEEAPGDFHIITAYPEFEAEYEAARNFVKGVLFALAPPDPLDQIITTGRAIWPGDGRAVAGWQFRCGHPGCVVVTGVRIAERERAESAILQHQWKKSAARGWVCPVHAAHLEDHPDVGSEPS